MQCPGQLVGTIELKGLRCSSPLGDPPSPTAVLVDVRLELDLVRVAATDAYADTVDLADLAATIRGALAGRPRLLLEAAAAHAANEVLRHYPAVETVRLRLARRDPPDLDADEEAVTLEVPRDRAAEGRPGSG